MELSNAEDLHKFSNWLKLYTLVDQITVLLTRTVFMTKCPLDTGFFDRNTHTRGGAKFFKKTFSLRKFQKDKIPK